MSEQEKSDHPLQKCTDPADPNRCQGVGSQGQCWNLAADRAQMCMMHGGNMQQNKAIQEDRDMYQVDMYRARIARQKGHPEVKSLTNEIALLRMMLEEKLRSCTDNTTLLLHAASISELIMKIDKLVNSCHKLEKNMGLHLDKAVLLQFSAEIVALIGNVCKNKNEISQLADGILEIVANVEG